MDKSQRWLQALFSLEFSWNTFFSLQDFSSKIFITLITSAKVKHYKSILCNLTNFYCQVCIHIIFRMSLNVITFFIRHSMYVSIYSTKNNQRIMRCACCIFNFVFKKVTRIIMHEKVYQIRKFMNWIPSIKFFFFDEPGVSLIFHDTIMKYCHGDAFAYQWRALIFFSNLRDYVRYQINENFWMNNWEWRKFLVKGAEQMAYDVVFQYLFWNQWNCLRFNVYFESLRNFFYKILNK